MAAGQKWALQIRNIYTLSKLVTLRYDWQVSKEVISPPEKSLDFLIFDQVINLKKMLGFCPDLPTGLDRFT